MKKFIITKEARDAILAYLLNRPMVEVEQGVFILRNLEEIKEETKNGN